MSKIKNNNEIQGKVLMILNEYRLVIDLGEDKVAVGDIVSVIDKSIPITNLEGERIGTYTFSKAELIITEIHEKYSICFSNETTKQSSISSTFATVLSDRVVTKPLIVNEEQNMNVRLSEKEISVGDTVIVEK